MALLVIKHGVYAGNTLFVWIYGGGIIPLVKLSF